MLALGSLGDLHARASLGMPCAKAISAGWDRPEDYHWPVQVINKIYTEDKEIWQFLVYSEKKAGYRLCSWSSAYLEALDGSN